MPDKPDPFDPRRAALALLAALAMLIQWRVLYPATPWAVVFWIVPAWIVARGTHARTRALIRVWRSALWNPGSFVARWLTGRMAALWQAGIALVAVVPVLAHVALTGNRAELSALFAVALAAFGLSLVLARRLHRQTAPGLTLPVATRLGWWGAGAAGTVAVFAISLFWTPLPDYLDAASWGQALARTTGDLPGHGGPVAWLMAALAAVEAMGYLLAREETRLVASPVLLIFRLVYDALAAFSFARLGSDAAMLLRSGDKTADSR